MTCESGRTWDFIKNEAINLPHVVRGNVEIQFHHKRQALDIEKD